jgi:hypothetical protein
MEPLIINSNDDSENGNIDSNNFIASSEETKSESTMVAFAAMSSSKQHWQKEANKFHLNYLETQCCQVCGTSNESRLIGGHTCTHCEYNLCKDCSVVYCRKGHAMKIWTLPEAISQSCNLCKIRYGKDRNDFKNES